MTELEALKFTRATWMWLAKHPEKQKEDWPGFKKHPEWENDCACCEYVSLACAKQPKRNQCELCPLLGFAWNPHCCGPSSPYEGHKNSTRLWVRRKYAMKIVNACNRAIRAKT